MKEILVIGDSHVSVFNSEYMTSKFPKHKFEVISVGGATVSGLINPNATTQAMPQYLEALKSTKANTVIVMLGEVDTGFVIWYRSQKHGTPVNYMLQQALDNYKNFISDIAKKFTLICISTPLPTIRDNTDWGEVANLRREVKATQAERTELTLAFNESMKVFCLEAGLFYLSLDEQSMDENGQLKLSLRNSDPNDHHYDPTAHAAMIAPLLSTALSGKHRWYWPFRWNR
ncbi:SGNH/GDSL hydrolase family protein [Pseudomonas sp. C2B4]|uniref:SGNH/GDSL hydrolase family protein n=1 Tax=Pseudomonas sp. C2B4 TaxID=2735270 RepID=UPI00158650FB|nr:SGNH/GDSL hydrolase family protein [Pseudomonas sp. C2B4]